MELTDAARRILGQHWRLIACCMLVAAFAVVLVVPRAPTYTASARLILDAPDPQTSSETTGIADTARAIATSPSEIRAAMRSAGVKDRDPAALGLDSVSVASLGQSAIVDLSVSDRDPRVAAALANALVARVIRTRLAVTRGQAAQVTAGLDQRISSIDRQIVTADSAIGKLTIELAAAKSPTDVNALRALSNESLQQRDLLDQTRSSLESQRISLLSASAVQRYPSVLSAATLPRTADSSGIVTDLVLAIFLGLVVGIGISSVIESLRPKLIGGYAVARELDAPLLGTLSTQPGEASQAEVEPLALRVRLAGKAAGLPNIRIVPVRDGTDLGSLARLLDDRSGVSADDGGLHPASSPSSLEPAVVGREGGASGPVTTDAPYRIRAFDPESVLMNGARIGLVLVSPDRLAKSELEAATHLLRVAPGQLLGVVTYRELRRLRRSEGSSNKV